MKKILLYKTFAAGILFIIASCNAEYFSFTESERNFIPYELGDSLYVVHSNDTVIILVNYVSESKLKERSGTLEYYDFKSIRLLDTTVDYRIWCKLSKRSNLFTADISIDFPDGQGNFYYDHSIPAQDELLLNDQQYYNVIKLESDDASELYLNDEGFILLTSDMDEYYFFNY